MLGVLSKALFEVFGVFRGRRSLCTGISGGWYIFRDLSGAALCMGFWGILLGILLSIFGKV